MSSNPTTVSGPPATLDPSSFNSGAKSGTSVTGLIAATTAGTVAPTTVVANTLIFVGVAIAGSQTVSTITDTHSLGWKKLAGATISTGTVRGEVWWAFEPTAQTHTITITLSASGNAAMVANMWAGTNVTLGANVGPTFACPMDPASPFTAIGTGTAAAVPVTTLNPADVLIGFIACVGAPATITVGSGFSIASAEVSQSTNVSAAMEYQVLTAAQPSISTNYTISTSEAWVMIGFALISAGLNTYLIQATGSQEFVLKNVIYGGQCTIARWDGTNAIALENPNGPGSQQFGSFQVTAPAATIPSWYVVINTSTTSAMDVGYDGTRSA